MSTGKLADLLIVDGDPLADIAMLQEEKSIVGVWLGGKPVNLPEMPAEMPRHPSELSQACGNRLYTRANTRGGQARIPGAAGGGGLGVTTLAADRADALRRYHFPASDGSRIPYGHVPGCGDLRHRAAGADFSRARWWNYLALECEIPAAGDFRVVAVGDTPVIVDRARDGTVSRHGETAVLTAAPSCSDRFRAMRAGHICCYHQWSYDLTGKLVSVPFRRGVKGVGGLPDDFDMKCHSLQALRVAVLNGVIFGSFSEDAAPLEKFLDAPFVAQDQAAVS